MKLRVRIRTIFRLILFFTAYKIIASYNEREWGWLRNSTNNLEKNNVEDYYHEIRVYSVYLKDKVRKLYSELILRFQKNCSRNFY